MATGNTKLHPMSTALVAVLVVTLMLSLLGSISSTSPAAATLDEVRWSRVNIPTEGEGGNWVLAGSSDVQHLAMASDGSLYAYANPSGTGYTLFKSTDAGYSWSHIGEVKDIIVALATAPDDADIIYYATASSIYKSADGGNSFKLWGREAGGAGSANVTIASLAVIRQESHYLVAIGTGDSDSSQYGGVYTLNESKSLPSWLDTNIGNYDVLALAFSPNFSSDRQLVAVVTNEVDTLIISRIDDGGWGKVIANATIEGLVARAAVITFPDGYDAAGEDPTLFVGIDSGGNQGDVYRVNLVRGADLSWAADLDIGDAYNQSNVDVSGLAISGKANAASLLAGAAGSTQVYISTDSGLNWTRSRKKPTGQSQTSVVMAPDFTSSRIAYATTIGTESAFSYTTDGGVIWNQAGLIDTTLSSIVDLAVSPNYSQDDTLFILTFDGTHTEHSLWRSLNGGARWERVFTSAMPDVDSINLVELSPGYGDGSKVVFLAGTGGGNPVIWKSTDNSQTFRYQGAPSSVDIWAVVNDNTLFLGSYNGSSGLVYNTTNSGLSYSDEVAVGSQPLKSIALSPNYEQDETIMIGNTNGWVYYSSDNGTSFKPLPADATSPPLTGEITVAFDSEFTRNKTVYAASNSANKGIYRFIINKSTKWESIDSTLPVGGMLSQLAVSNGVLYATNSQSVDSASKKGGMERSLNPTYSLGPTFETVTRSLDDGATLSGMWLRGNQLWSIDTQNTKLMTYVDSLALPVTLTSPPDKTSGTGARNVILEWETLRGATEYKWQLDYDTDFSTVPTDFEGDTKASSARLPALDTDTTYHWRVKATEPVLSQWSAKWDFTTGLGSKVVAPELYSPEAGDSEVPPKPLFQWSAIAGADSYELIVSTDASFSNPTIVKIGDYALPATAWQSNINLDYNTAYYWKVRAIGSGSYSAWSAVGVFTTELPPAQPSPSPELSPSPPPELPPSPPPLSPSTPPSPPPAQSAFPDWAIYLGGALLLAIVILLITVLVLVVTIRRA